MLGIATAVAPPLFVHLLGDADVQIRVLGENTIKAIGSAGRIEVNARESQVVGLHSNPCAQLPQGSVCSLWVLGLTDQSLVLQQGDQRPRPVASHHDTIPAWAREVLVKFRWVVHGFPFFVEDVNRPCGSAWT